MPITTVYDTEDQFSWASKTTSLDDTDALIFKGTTFDNGLIIIDFYENNVVYRTMLEDTAQGDGQFNWSDKTIEFDGNGIIQSEETTFDNGVNQYDRYEFGALAQVTLWDDANIEGWQRIDTEYDLGIMTQQVIVYDNEMVLRSLYGVNGDLTSRSKSDVGDVKDWTTYAESFDADGNLEVAQFYFDNGLTYTEIFSGGILNVIYETDELDVRSWDTRDTFYDPNGELVAKVTTYDNGIVKAEEWSGGQRSFISQSDAEDVASWETIETYFYEGEKVANVTTYDNGIVRAEEWQDDLRSYTRQDDVSDARNWETVETYFNAGERVAHVTTFDDGIVRAEEWQNDLRSVTNQDDTQDVKSWETINTYFDQNGVQVAKVTTYDNGIVQAEEWSNGNRTTTTREDTNDVASWDRVTTYYNAETGLISGRVKVMDNGVERYENFREDGTLIAVEARDTADAFAWDMQSSLVAPNGMTAMHQADMDNGDQILTVYQQEDGQRDWRMETDGDNSHDWAFRVTEYDIDGENPTVATYDSLDELPEPYIDYTGAVLGL